MNKKFITSLNSFFFKVFSQRPVSHHLKKSQMRIIPYFININSPDTFLDIEKPCSQRVLLTSKIRDKRLHSRNIKKGC